MEQLTDGLIWYLAFLFSTTFHEAAHSFAAMKMGDLTALQSGQVTLNPIPHIRREPFGMAIIPLISFFSGGWLLGWGSAPYNAEWAYQYPKKAAAMAAAGPMANFILLLVTAALIHTGMYFGVLYAPERVMVGNIVASSELGLFWWVAKILSIMFSLNTILFIFNMIPFPPLDGSGILPMYLSEELGRKYMSFIHHGAFMLIGLFISWKLFGMIYWKLQLVFINTLYWEQTYR
ncbi:MAG: site-2 protease family protein [Ignavibacteriales bacterium]|nr:site-2 protease family protein [Ignavibacteriales bacterium]